MQQTSFLHPKIKTFQKYSETKDLKCIGYTQDKVRWAVKREQDKPGMPLAEWIGHHLCRLLGIATPDFAIVECPDGELAFGSRWEQDFEQIGSAMPVNRQFELLSNHAKEISEVHAVDKAVTNPDRHAGNFLFVKRADSTVCLAFDFSQAYPTHPHPFGKRLPPCSTLRLIIDVMHKRLQKFDEGLADTKTHQLKALDRSSFIDIIQSAPTSWFATVGYDDLCKEWDNFVNEKPSVSLPA